MDNAIPKFDQNRLPFFRKEKDGYLSLIAPSDPNSLVQLLNKTAVEIVKLCNGSLKVGEIASKMQKKYPNTDSNLITESVKTLLVRLDRSNLLTWVKGNPFYQEKSEKFFRIIKNITIKRNTEGDFRSIFKFIHSGFLEGTENNLTEIIYMAPSNFRELYNELVLRSKLFNFKEDFYTLYLRNQPIFLVGMYNNRPIKSTATLSIAVLQKKVSLSDVMDILFPYLLQDAKNIVDKITCYVKKSSKKQDKWVSRLMKSGFKQEAVLKDEYGNGINEEIYSIKLTVKNK